MSDEPADLSMLRWRCRRGTKELDTLTTKYLEKYYLEAEPDEQCAFTQLLALQDPQLHGILTENVKSDDPFVQAIVDKIHSI